MIIVVVPIIIIIFIIIVVVVVVVIIIIIIIIIIILSNIIIIIIIIIIILSNIPYQCDIKCAGHFTLDALASRPVACLNAFEMSSAKWRPSCHSLNVLTNTIPALLCKHINLL